MRFQPAIGSRPMHRRAVFADVTTRAQECMVDRADCYPASMIGLKPICNFEEFLQRGFRIGERPVLFEFHVPVLPIVPPPPVMGNLNWLRRIEFK